MEGIITLAILLITILLLFICYKFEKFRRIVRRIIYVVLLFTIVSLLLGNEYSLIKSVLEVRSIYYYFIAAFLAFLMSSIIAYNNPKSRNLNKITILLIGWLISMCILFFCAKIKIYY